MPKYFYTAKSFEGEERSGVLEAKDKHELARILRQEGFLLTSAVLGEKEAKKGFEIRLPALFGVSLKEKVFFTRNLKVMIAAGIALPRALRILSTQTKNKKFEKALLNIASRITKGEGVAASLAQHPDIFSELFVNMVKVGEEAGTLEEVLDILTRHLERINTLKSKVKGALVYPAVILLAMIGIGILMLVMVVPKLAITFEELKIELPATTKLVIALGEFLAQRWYVLLGAIPLCIFLLRQVLKTKTGKKTSDSLLLKIPVFSPLIRKTNSAYMVRTLGSLLASGVPVVRSLEITSGALENFYFREAVAEAAKKVRGGGKISGALEDYPIFPSLVIQMLEVGEETGETSNVLEKLADFFEEEVTNTTKNLAAVIEPVLMLIIGGVVGFFAISMVQPMYSMLEAIK